jgi:hypothetical protein
MAEDTTTEDTTIGKTMEELLEAFKNAQVEDRQNIINQAAELQDYEEKKEQRDKDLKKILDDGIKKQMGETGFRGLIKTSKEGINKLLTEQRTMKELFSDLKSSFSSDISLVTGALAPLTAIPGVSTILGIIKFAFLVLWKGIQKFWAWQKAARAEDRARARLAVLGQEGEESVAGATTEKKTVILGFFGKLWRAAKLLLIFLGALLLGFFLALTKPFRVVAGWFWRPIWSGIRFLSSHVGNFIKHLGTRFFGPNSWLRKQLNPQSAKYTMTAKEAVANYKKQLAAGTFQKAGVTGPPGRLAQAMTTGRAWFSGLTSRVSGIFATIKNSKIITGIMGFFSAIGSGLQAIANLRIVRFALRLAGWLTFWIVGPIVAIIGFFEGFTSTEGSFWDKLKGGFLGAMWGLFDFFIVFWADLGVWAMAKLGEMFGFDMTWLTDWSAALWEALKAGFMAMIPGGDTPLEAFSKKWSEVMEGRAASRAAEKAALDDPEKRDAALRADELIKSDSASAGEEIELYRNNAQQNLWNTSSTAAPAAQFANINTNIVNNNSSINVIETTEPGDKSASLFAWSGWAWNQ